jgi:hypothetical protein
MFRYTVMVKRAADGIVFGRKALEERMKCTSNDPSLGLTV